ncbi:M56 family metallopeptidase [Anaerocolumna sp. AGMB13020]|uniref:M56 family metallopeptidase n=1 Tax=Anaerocolumna sp. AGMB13020 TaxID=3081750 RepID=UPI0029554256|nr:M56 family metallopeptidase [Anaerocolumna sp. AGMB13020]WOO37592.1 M56 family metallopeptidase [Anaerocolumna sp. AGMB13020]
MSIFNESLFHIILNMSITSSVVIFSVLLIRVFFKKLPKVFSYALWFIVLFRLLCPVTLESSVSIFSLFVKENNTASIMEPVPYNIGYQKTPEVNLYIPPVTASVNKSLPAATPYASINPMQFLMFLTELLWCIVIAFMLLTGSWSALRLKLTLRTACRLKDNIYTTNALSSPFVFGIISPKIYLPANLSETEKEYIILHEQTHIKRFDHVIKLLWHIALCIHWFNPLVWISFRFMERDMEMSCDEAVIKIMGEEIKAAYSTSLFQMSNRKKSIKTYLTPLAFGETGLKTRVKNILSYKRPVLWITSVSVTIILLIAVTLLTNPKNDTKTKLTKKTTEQSEYNQNATEVTATTAEPLSDSSSDIIDNNRSQAAENKLASNNMDNTGKTTYQITAVNSSEGAPPADITILNSDDTIDYINRLILQLYASSYYSQGTDLELPEHYYRITATLEDSSTDYYFFAKEGTAYIQIGKSGRQIPLPLKDYMILSYLLQPNLEAAQVVEDNLETMLAAPLPYSNTALVVQKLIDKYSLEYDNILKCGDVALSYMLICFQKGEGDSLKGELMMLLCNEILGDRSNSAAASLTPTEWFRTLTIMPASTLPNYTYEGEDPILKLVYESETEIRKNKELGFLILAPYIWDYYSEGTRIKVFATIYYSYYNLYGLNLSVNGSSIIPVAITYRKNTDGNYYQENYKEAADGSYFNTSIRDFCTTPESNKEIPGLADKIINNYSDNSELQKIMEANLKEHLKKYGLEDVTIQQ